MALRSAMLATAAAFHAGTALADVTLSEGPTPIPNGAATAEGDLTVRNNRLAFSIAVESQAPWGVPRGAIIDVAPIADGEIGVDPLTFADFIPNNWSAWPSEQRDVEILSEDPEEVSIRIMRDFGEAEIETTYTLEDGSDRVHLVTEMTNTGEDALEDQVSGFTLWPETGYIFEVPGLQGVEAGPAGEALSDRVVAYDADWFIALHAPYLEQVDYGSKDLYASHSLAPGESRRFEGWLQVGAAGDLAPVVAAEIEREQLGAGTITGEIGTADGPAEDSVLVVEKEGEPYAWTLASEDGAYDIALPEGEYSVYATAAGHSRSTPEEVSVAADGETELDFTDLQGPGTLNFAVADEDGEPLAARISIAEGQAPLIEFLGRQTYFTELAETGRVEAELAPGDYTFTVGHGTGFLTEGEEIDVTVESGAEQDVDVTLEMVARPFEHDWFASDMHHHADQLEGTTPPEFLARSELAAGLDMILVSDHDSTVNFEELSRLAEEAGVPFIPSLEYSPSWGHFNAYPLDLDSELRIDTSTATAAEVMAEARRMGADAIQVNHPFIPYGYLASLEAGSVPGGFASDFDLLEMNDPGDDEAVFERAAQFWDQGRRIYLSGGSDAHDVWNDDTGSARAYVHVPGGADTDGFVANLKAGHAYVTRGPIILPDVMFGSELRLQPGEDRTLGFDLTAVNGLAEAVLVGPDGEIDSQTFEDSPQNERAEFGFTGGDAAWVALKVEDAEGKMAYSNPIWTATLSEEDALPTAQ